jgi:hypothetical protein
MKKTVITLLILSVTTLAYCAATQMYVTFNVTDDNDQPVADARVEVFFQSGAMSNRDDDLTNKNGTATLTGTGHLGFDFRITKEGYYKSVSGKGPGSQSIDVVLREVRNPIAMYAKKLVFLNLDENQFSVSYDLVSGDYLPPYGNGKVSDILFEGENNREDLWTFSNNINVSFPGEGNGIQRFQVPIEKIYSEFRSAYQAPQSGYSKGSSFYSRKDGSGTPRETNYDPSANYYFRIRADKDVEGNIVSALYGKIYGEFNQSGGVPYYVNPTPNDRNIEFDWRQNLFGGLPQNERVTAP